MEVKLINYTKEPLKAIFIAIRSCYSPFAADYIENEEYPKYVAKSAHNYPNDAVRLASSVADMKHLSVLEHVNFTFAISGVSRSLLAQFTRHRIGWSFNVQSQRYVKMSSGSKHGGFEYVTPHSVEDDEKALAVYDSLMESIQDAYDKLVELGVKAEDARYVLPNATETNIIVTCNLRAFMDFYDKRNEDTHSQWEIAELAEEMKWLILVAEPQLGYVMK